MSPPPIPLNFQDENHLNALKICYYVMAGLGVLGLLFLLVHYAMMASIFGVISKSPEVKDAQTLQEMPSLFIGFYAIFAVIGLVQIILNLWCARALGKRQTPTFIQVVAGLNCMGFPLGTVLGVFTFIVLARPAVHRHFKNE